MENMAMTFTFEYAPAPESSAIAAIKDRYLPYIDGTFVEGGGADLPDVEVQTAPLSLPALTVFGQGEA